MTIQINIVTVDRLFPVFLYTLACAIRSRRPSQNLIAVSDKKGMVAGVETIGPVNVPSDRDIIKGVYLTANQRDNTLFTDVKVVHYGKRMRGINLVTDIDVVSHELSHGVKTAFDYLPSAQETNLQEVFQMLRYAMFNDVEINTVKDQELHALSNGFIWWLSGLPSGEQHTFDVEQTSVSYEKVKHRTQKVFEATTSDKKWNKFKLKMLHKIESTKKPVFNKEYWTKLLDQ